MLYKIGAYIYEIKNLELTYELVLLYIMLGIVFSSLTILHKLVLMLTRFIVTVQCTCSTAL